MNKINKFNKKLNQYLTEAPKDAMSISELIKQLERVKHEHRDLKVFVGGEHGSYRDDYAALEDYMIWPDLATELFDSPKYYTTDEHVLYLGA